jgi:hypothetical protein
MKLGTLLMTASLAVAALSGCASAPPQTAARSAARTEQQTDAALVQAVERQAQLVGVQVIWVNVPTKAVPVAAGS